MGHQGRTEWIWKNLQRSKVAEIFILLMICNNVQKAPLLLEEAVSQFHTFFINISSLFPLEALAGLPTTSLNGYLPLIEAKLKVDAEPEAS